LARDSGGLGTDVPEGWGFTFRRVERGYYDIREEYAGKPSAELDAVYELMRRLGLRA
jgi:hypothetical protein